MEVFQHHHCRAQKHIGKLGKPKQAFDLLRFHLFGDLLRQRRHLNWLRSLAFPWFDLGFRFRQRSSDLSFTGSAFFQGQGSACESTGTLVKCVPTDVGDTGILASKLHARFGTILTALFSAGKTTMQAFEAFEFGAQGFGILHHSTIGTLCQPIDPHSYSDWLGRSSRWIRHFLFNLNGDKPPPGLLRNSSRKHVHPTGRHIPTFFQAKSAQPRQVNGFLADMNGAGQPETAQPLPFGFVFRITRRAFPLSLFFELDPAKEISHRLVQIAQRLLRSRLRDLVHPGQLGLLELVQLPMKLHRADPPARSLVDLLLAPQAPVVRIAVSPGVLLAGRNLLVVEIQFGTIAPRQPHRCALPKEVLETRSFCTGRKWKQLSSNPADSSMTLPALPPKKLQDPLE